MNFSFQLFFSCFLNLWLNYVSSEINSTEESTRYLFPIVFVFIGGRYVCKHDRDSSLPDYIKYSIKQSYITQSDCKVILITNYKDCPSIRQSFPSLHKATNNDSVRFEIVDSTEIRSNKTLAFEQNPFPFFSSIAFHLWVSSALRFFYLEDLMKSRSYSEMLHVEADNMLYGRITTILPLLRKHYTLAVTPLSVTLNMLTASVLWVSRLERLEMLNDFILSCLDYNSTVFVSFVNYLRANGGLSSKSNAVFPLNDSVGMKPAAFNEMSMLAFYHNLFPKELMLFPVIPGGVQYAANRHVQNVSGFTPRGGRVGDPTGHAIWDSGSYGQYLAGTPNKRGTNKGYQDQLHIAGLALGATGCSIIFYCHPNITDFDYADPKQMDSSSRTLYQKQKVKEQRCYTAPYVQCGQGTRNWTPLWNMHIHAKHTFDYESKPCDCNDINRGKTIIGFINNTDYHWKPPVPLHGVFY
jgi:hypothetical protein